MTSLAESTGKKLGEPRACVIVVAVPRTGLPVVLDSYGKRYRRGERTWANIVEHEIEEFSGDNTVGVEGAIKIDTEGVASGIHLWVGAHRFLGRPGDPDGDVDGVWEGEWMALSDEELRAVADGEFRQYMSEARKEFVESGGDRRAWLIWQKALTIRARAAGELQ